MPIEWVMVLVDEPTDVLYCGTGAHDDRFRKVRRHWRALNLSIRNGRNWGTLAERVRTPSLLCVNPNEFEVRPDGGKEAIVKVELAVCGNDH